MYFLPTKDTVFLRSSFAIFSFTTLKEIHFGFSPTMSLEPSPGPQPLTDNSASLSASWLREDKTRKRILRWSSMNQLSLYQPINIVHTQSMQAHWLVK